MRKIKRFCVCAIVTMVLLTSCTFTGFGEASPIDAKPEAALLSSEQRNAIAMLNYITVLTRDINASKNSRLYMEEAYSALINNTYPNAVDARTQSQLTGLLDIMESYRMIGVKRDRLQYIYEQNQAQAIRAAVPNPLGLLSAAQSYRPGKLAASLLYMAIDSVTSYMAYAEEADLQYIKDGWALDDEESETLHNSRKGTFSYMISMVRDNDLPGDLALTENAVDELVDWKNNDNTVGCIRFLESNREIYKSYGGYWLILAENYYNNGDFVQCLEALDTYEALDTRIFRRDYELAKILPLAVAAADEAYDGKAYVEIAARYARTILDNTDHDEWALRYFAAQTFVDLYAQTRDRAYLEEAYDIAVDNVNYLVGEQKAMNAAFLAPVQLAVAPTDATKDEKEQIKQYNTMLNETRKTELPPVYEPLILNCDLLFGLADTLDIPQSERLNIDGILHLRGEPIFLTKPLDDKYWFLHATAEEAPVDFEIEYGGTAMILPVESLTKDAVITATVKEADAEGAVTLADWRIDKVERSEEGGVSTFKAVYVSDEARNHAWAPDAQIHIEISPRAGMELPVYRFDFTTEGTKKEWYDYLKVWEGHRNNWYDYTKVWENSVVFVQVK